MNHVVNILEWCKSNVIILVCGVVMLLSLLTFIWPSSTSAAKFRADMTARQSELGSISGLMKTPIPLPVKSEAPAVSDVVTKATVERLIELSKQMSEDTEGVSREAIRLNREGNSDYEKHEPMLDNLFPAPPSNQRSAVLRAAGEEFKARLEDLYANLNAGMPPSDNQVQALLDLEDQLALEQAVGGQLDDKEKQVLANRKASRVQTLYRDKARTFHIYCPPVGGYAEQASLADQPPPDADKRGGPGNPVTAAPREEGFDFGPFQEVQWPFGETDPNIADIWESQMQLWILQDVVEAIVKTNNIRTADGKLNSQTNLTEQPVKQLIFATVLPPGTRPIDPNRNPGASGGEGNRGFRPGGGPTPGPPPSFGAIPGNAGAPGGTAPKDETIKDSDYEAKIGKRLTDDFGFSPTGRETNLLYDVRHVDLRLVVDAKQVYKLFHAIHTTNLMTVVGMKITDLDEYNEFEQGYFYGEEVDAVILDLVVETIWFREWTAGHHSEELAKKKEVKYFEGLMPDEVRYQLKLPTRDPNFKPENAGPSGFQ